MNDHRPRPQGGKLRALFCDCVLGKGVSCVTIVHQTFMLLCSSSIISMSFLVMVMQASTTYYYYYIIIHIADVLTHTRRAHTRSMCVLLMGCGGGEVQGTHTSTQVARRGMLENRWKHRTIYGHCVLPLMITFCVVAMSCIT